MLINDNMEGRGVVHSEVQSNDLFARINKELPVQIAKPAQICSPINCLI